VGAVSKLEGHIGEVAGKKKKKKKKKQATEKKKLHPKTLHTSCTTAVGSKSSECAM